MKTKLILCMLLIVALLMTGCNTSVIPPDLPHDSDSSDTGGETGSETTGGDTTDTESVFDEETTAAPPEWVEPDPNRPYLITDSGRYVYCDQRDSDIEFQYRSMKEVNPVEERVFYPYDSYKDETNDATRKLTFNGRETEVQYKESRSYNGEASSLHSLYYNCDFYYDEQSKTTFQYLQDTGLLVWCNRSMTDQEKNVSPRLSAEEATYIANRFFTEQLGSDWYGKYELNREVVWSGGQFAKYYRVDYTKEIHGYKTKDEISVCVSALGDVLYYDASYAGLFEGYEDIYTLEMIQAAETDLLDAMDRLRLDMEVYETVLDMTTSGDLLLIIRVTVSVYDVWLDDYNYYGNDFAVVIEKPTE